MSSKEKAIVEALPERIQLDEADLRTGLALAHQVAQAQSRLQTLTDVEQVFATEMRRKYAAPENYQMTDWITGFKQVDNGNNTD